MGIGAPTPDLLCGADTTRQRDRVHQIGQGTLSPMPTTFPNTRNPMGDGEFDLVVPVDDDGYVYYSLSIILRYTVEAGGQLPGIDAREICELMTIMSNARLDWCRNDTDEYRQDLPLTLSASAAISRVRDWTVQLAENIEHGTCTVLPDLGRSHTDEVAAHRRTAEHLNALLNA